MTSDYECPLSVVVTTDCRCSSVVVLDRAFPAPFICAQCTRAVNKTGVQQRRLDGGEAEGRECVCGESGDEGLRVWRDGCRH